MSESQEPVACPYCHNSATLGAVYFDQNCVGCVKRMSHPPKRTWVGSGNLEDSNAYLVSPQRTEQEPWCMKMNGCKTNCEDCPDEPPQRTWVGLTNEEVELYWDWEDFQCGCGPSTLFAMVRDIEARLKDRNT